MKTVIEIENERIQKLKEKGLIHTKDISDGYHTIGELYDHRMALTVALCNMIEKYNNSEEIKPCVYCYKSWLHSDGTMYDGMFIVVIEDSTQGQLSYHYNKEHWDKFDIPELPTALMYDGHTSNDVIERLMKL